MLTLQAAMLHAHANTQCMPDTRPSPLLVTVLKKSWLKSRSDMAQPVQRSTIVAGYVWPSAPVRFTVLPQSGLLLGLPVSYWSKRSSEMATMWSLEEDVIPHAPRPVSYQVKSPVYSVPAAAAPLRPLLG